MMNYLNLGLGSILLKDRSISRINLFKRYVAGSFLRYVLFMIAERFKTLAAVPMTFYAAAQTMKFNLMWNSDQGNVVVYEYSNELRCIRSRYKNRLNGSIGLDRYLWNFKPLVFIFSQPGHWSILLRLFKICMLKIKRKGILVGTRQAQFLFLYFYSIAILRRKNLKETEFIISTESNPNVIAVALAGKKLGAKIIYVNHGFLNQDLGIFFHDELVVQGEFLAERIKDRLWKAKNYQPQFVIVGPYFNPQPLNLPQKLKKIGFICSINPSLEKTLSILNNVKKYYPETIIEVRPHPNKLVSKNFYRELAKESQIRILDIVDWSSFNPDWDFALAGNTSAHMDLITLGIPSVGVDIDDSPWDQYGFFSSKFIFALNSFENLPVEITNFYTKPEWPVVSQKFLSTKTESI